MDEHTPHFAPANLPEKLAPRIALMHGFHRAAGKRIAMVVAPAGSGKTVSAMLWLRDSERIPVWIQLEPRLRSPAAFYRRLGEALATLQSGNAAVAEALAVPDFDDDPIRHVISLIRTLHLDDESYCLVFDDFHLVADSDIMKSLPEVLAALPASFVSFILSRVDPLRNVPDAAFSKPGKGGRRSRKFGLIPATSLAFTADEIDGYFRDCGREVNAEEIEAVRDRTGGWAMGVDAVARGGVLPIGETSFEDCLFANVWPTWEPDLREFLLDTCVVDECTPKLAHLLTAPLTADANAAEEMFERVQEKSGFLVRLSDRRRRYHHLFLDFLRRQREREKRGNDAELFRKAAGYFRENEQHYEALRASLRGGDAAGVEEGMAALFQYNTRSNSVARHAELLRTYLVDVVPDAALEQLPLLLINYIWYHYLMGNAERVAHYFDPLYEQVPALIAAKSPVVELILCLSTLDFRFGPTEKFREIASLMTVADDGNRPQTVTVTENQPYYHRCNQDYSSLAADFEAGMHDAEESFTALLGPEAPVILSGLRAALLYERNNLAEAAAWAKQSADAFGKDTVAELRFATGIVGAVVARAGGGRREFKARMHQLREFLEAGATYLLPNFHAIADQFALADADVDAAKTWLARDFVSEPEQPELYRIHQHFTTARAYIVLGRVEQALDWLAKLEHMGRECRRTLDESEARVLRSVVEWAAGRRDEAAATLRRTLETLRPYGFVRIVANEGASIIPVLTRIRSDLKQERSAASFDADFSTYVDKLHAAARAEAARSRGIAWNLRARPVRLAKQQKRILQLAETGMVQTKIAAELGLALPTVKAHLAVVFRKLKVNRTQEAVQKAREMQLL